MAKTKHRSFHADRHSTYDEEEQLMRTKQYRMEHKRLNEIDFEELEDEDPRFHMYRQFLTS